MNREDQHYAQKKAEGLGAKAARLLAQAGSAIGKSLRTKFFGKKGGIVDTEKKRSRLKKHLPNQD